MTSVNRFANALENVIMDVVRKLGPKKLASKPQPIGTAQTFSNRGGHEVDGLRLIGKEREKS